MSEFCADIHNCYGYAHKHCSVCGEILPGEGGGGFDGRRVSGYENAVTCSGCGDDLLCRSCAKGDSRCVDCRKVAA